MFQLDEVEHAGLRSQNATLKGGRGTHRKYLPYVFTEQGVAMLSSVLSSERAVQVNIAIMRAFVQMRELANKFAELEQRMGKHDEAIRTLFDAIRQMMQPAGKKRKGLGFRVEEGAGYV
jgi:chromosome segregation ATPase